MINDNWSKLKILVNFNQIHWTFIQWNYNKNVYFSFYLVLIMLIKNILI